MFTEHEVEIFALHINFFNLNELFFSLFMQHTDEMYQESGFWGAFFCTVYCRIAGASGNFAPWTRQRLCLGSTGEGGGGLAAPPRQATALGNDIRSLHIVPLARYHFHPCPHDKFGPPLNSLKKGLL